jgi:pyridoxine/pyridoxamine 5'-phosphate oxidase
MKMTIDEGLSFEDNLVSKGYRRVNENYKKSDYVYWKSFNQQVDADGDKISGYSVGIAFYDFSKYPQHRDEKKIAISLECLITDHAGLDRIDMTVTDSNTTIEEFEEICKSFYEFFVEMHRTKLERDN